MRISVTDIGCTFGRQTRAYAEYRIFSSVARFGDVVHEADVSLTSRRAGGAARCVVALTVDDGGRLRSAPEGVTSTTRSIVRPSASAKSCAGTRNHAARDRSRAEPRAAIGRRHR